MNIINNLTKEEFNIVIKDSKCYAEILRKLNLRHEGGYYRTLKNRIKKESVDVSHFLTLSELMKGKSHKGWISKEKFLIRLENNLIKSDTIKIKLIEFSILPYECNECHIKNLWNNKKLILQLDHKDGNHRNNKLENLRWLCPNCHSQTDTFCGKHKKKSKPNFCKNCNKNIHRKSTICKKCSSKNYGLQIRKVKNRPSKEELLNLIIKYPFTEIARRFEISDNSVRKWCKSYNLPFKRKDIKLVGDNGI